jgi:hypothetical protein
MVAEPAQVKRVVRDRERAFNVCNGSSLPSGFPRHIERQGIGKTSAVVASEEQI